MQVRSWRHGSDFIVYDGALIASPSPQLFDPDWWRAHGLIEGSFDGRAKVHIVRQGDMRWVLRRYLRGGLAARLTDHTYVWAGLARTRPWREWHLLAALRARGLPVPRPVGAHVRRVGWRYGGHLLTELIAGAQPFADLLLAGELGETDWREAGATLRRFHDAGVRHPDLNLRNILRGADGQIHVLDFDKGHLDGRARQFEAELQRLRRSVDKFCPTELQREQVRRGWPALIAAYRG